MFLVRDEVHPPTEAHEVDRRRAYNHALEWDASGTVSDLFNGFFGVGHVRDIY